MGPRAPRLHLPASLVQILYGKMGFEAILKINSSKSKSGSNGTGYECVTGSGLIKRRSGGYRRCGRTAGAVVPPVLAGERVKLQVPARWNIFYVQS
jgi:hypothetical protein